MGGVMKGGMERMRGNEGVGGVMKGGNGEDER